jgi:hypothetical protein
LGQSLRIFPYRGADEYWFSNAAVKWMNKDSAGTILTSFFLSLRYHAFTHSPYKAMDATFNE